MNMDYGDILVYIEQIVEAIEFDEIDLLEIKTKLENLAVDLEDNLSTSEEAYEDFGFNDLD